jgi:membrane protein
MSRWSVWQERWRAQATEALETLRDWPWFETLRTLRHRFREDRLGLTAGSLTFTTVISLVPLLTVMLAVFAAFPMFGSFQRALETYFLQALVPDEIARPALKALTQFAANAKRIGGVGALVLGATALAMMLTIDRTLNGIWRVRKPRPIAQRVLVYWAALTLGPLLIGVSLSVSSYALSASRGWVQSLPGGVSLLLDLAEFALVAMVMAGLFHHVPNTWVRWRHAFAGGLFVAVALEIAKAGLTWYLRTVPNFAAVYGTFATLPILLLWIFLGWVIVLLGAVIAAYAPSLQTGVARRVATPGHQFELALALLRVLGSRRGEAPHGLSAGAIATLLRTDPLQIEPVLDTLVGLDWVGRLDEEGGARHVLLCDPERTAVTPLVDALLLTPGAATRAFRQHACVEDMTLAQAMG